MSAHLSFFYLLNESHVDSCSKYRTHRAVVRINGINAMNQMVFKDRYKDFPKGVVAEIILRESVPGS